jgi:hypothetical protein
MSLPGNLDYLDELIESGEEIVFEYYNFKFKLYGIKTAKTSSGEYPVLMFKVFNEHEDSFIGGCLEEQLSQLSLSFLKYFDYTHGNVWVEMYDGDYLMNQYSSDAHFSKELLKQVYDYVKNFTKVRYTNVKYNESEDKSDETYTLEIEQQPISVTVEHNGDVDYVVLINTKLIKATKIFSDGTKEDITNKVNNRWWSDFIEYDLDFEEIWKEIGIGNDLFYTNPYLSCGYFDYYTNFID